MTVIDLDAEMVAHPRYDPKDPDSVYRLEEAWAFANARVEANFQASLTNRSYSRVIVDGTGTNIERQVRATGRVFNGSEKLVLRRQSEDCHESRWPVE